MRLSRRLLLLLLRRRASLEGHLLGSLLLLLLELLVLLPWEACVLRLHARWLLSEALRLACRAVKIDDALMGIYEEMTKEDRRRRKQ